MIGFMVQCDKVRKVMDTRQIKMEKGRMGSSYAKAAEDKRRGEGEIKMFIFVLIAAKNMCSFHRRRFRYNSLRYPGRNYSLPGKYFVTIVTAEKKEWFGTIINGEMQLSDIGSIAYKFWCEIPQHFPYITLGEYIIMPNHIHGIIIINRHVEKPLVGSLHATTLPLPDDVPMKNKSILSISPKEGSLSVIMRSYKSAVTRDARLINKKFSWQSGFYDTIICTTGQLTRIRKYIINNPGNWM